MVATKDTTNRIAKGTRSSKPVMTPEQPEQTIRVTRQKIAANLCIMDSTYDSLAPATPRGNEEQTNNPNEETTLKKYEKERAKNMIRNNQEFQRPGLGALTTLLNMKHETRKARAPEHSGSLYEAEQSDDSDEVGKATKDTTKGIAKGKRSSKPVMAPEQPEIDSTHDSLTPATPRGNEEQTNNPDKGCLCFANATTLGST